MLEMKAFQGIDRYPVIATQIFSSSILLTRAEITAALWTRVVFCSFTAQTVQTDPQEQPRGLV